MVTVILQATAQYELNIYNSVCNFGCHKSTSSEPKYFYTQIRIFQIFTIFMTC